MARRRRRNNNGGQGPSNSPQRTLSRTFRYMLNFQLDNSSGTGVDQYSYYTKYFKFNPSEAFGFSDACATFELWRMRRARVYIQPGYNDYNQSYNTINLDSALATTVWVASDFGINETISGVDLMSYHNARFHSLSLNKYQKICDTTVRLNQTSGAPITVWGPNTWLDTSLDMTNAEYSGFQIFTMMQGISGTDYLPKYQMVIEVDCEFKQPAWQNISTSFEKDAIGSKLDCEVSDQELSRVFVLTDYNRDGNGATLRFEREDGEPGSLTYSVADFHTVYATGRNVGYFGNRRVSYTG